MNNETQAGESKLPRAVFVLTRLVVGAVVLLLGILMFAGCAHHPPQTVQPDPPDNKPEGARMSTAEVIRIAKQAAEREGVT